MQDNQVHAIIMALLRIAEALERLNRTVVGK